jgi:hypothetical protein
MWTVLAWTGALAVSVVALEYFSILYMWIAFACAAALFVTAATDKPRRAWWFNVACLGVGLGIFEYYLWTTSGSAYAEDRVEEGTPPERVNVAHDHLGWAPRAGIVAREKISFAGEVIFDADYTIGANGLRISPPTDGYPPSAPCVLFFGDSFTFGQGLADHETLPFQVQEDSEQRYRTYNFGVNGYGAHQMLSALQHDVVDDAVPCDPAQVSHVFYQGIDEHVMRSAGTFWWEARGPRYALSPDGGVDLVGRLEDKSDDRTLSELIMSQFAKSFIYRSAVQGRFVHRYDRDDIELYVRIIDEARRTARAKFPAAEFYVLWWDVDNLDNETIREGLRQRGVTVHLMSDILPNYRTDALNLDYRLHPRDAHPNALANELIADYLVDEVLPQASVFDQDAQPETPRPPQSS